MASKPSAHTPENTVLAGGVRLPAGSEVIADGKRIRLAASAKAWQFTIRSSRLALGVPDHTLLVAERGEWAVCSCGSCVNRDRCTLVDDPAAILRHHGLLPPADPGGAVGEPPELAGPTECEDAARATPALDALVERLGNPWLVSRGHAGVSLTCVSCRRVRRFHDDGAACWHIAGGWRCSCGGGGPPPPAPGAARKPLDECLHDLYGPE